MKISDLEVGSRCAITLVVKSATPRETRAKKPFLALELYDGTDTIKANYWEWSTGNIPPVNTILDISATVTEYMGARQLNISSMTSNTEKVLADFAPVSVVDISSTYKAAYSMMSSIADSTLRTIALGVLEELSIRWLEIPGAKAVHHAYIGGTLAHSYSVACIAEAIASKIPEANHDLTVVGAMLHDVGKLFTYKVNGVNIDKTTDGMLYEHLFIGAEFIGNFAESHIDTDNPYEYAKVRLLRHIILSHHGKQEFGAAVTPMCIEAYIVNKADEIDANTEQIRQASSKAVHPIWTDKIYTLNNTCHITPRYIEEVFLGERKIE